MGFFDAFSKVPFILMISNINLINVINSILEADTKCSIWSAKQIMNYKYTWLTDK